MKSSLLDLLLYFWDCVERSCAALHKRYANIRGRSVQKGTYAFRAAQHDPTCGTVIGAYEVMAVNYVTIVFEEVGAVFAHHLGARRPGDRSHSLTCEPVSACLANI